MERPKAEREKAKRRITGEIMYLDSMRLHGLDPQIYPGDLSDMAIDMYEATADLFESQGVQPEIMDEYEKCDDTVPDLSVSCASLAEELLKLKEPGSTYTFEEFVVTMPAVEVLAKLKNIRAGEFLGSEDTSLATALSGDDDHPIEIKKREAILTAAQLSVYGWSDEKYFRISEPGEPEDILVYPADEKSQWYEMGITLSYELPNIGQITERVALYIGIRGGMSVYKETLASGYGEKDQEARTLKTFDDVTEEDIAAFADLVAEMVGDEPEAVWQRDDRTTCEA